MRFSVDCKVVVEGRGREGLVQFCSGLIHVHQRVFLCNFDVVHSLNLLIILLINNYFKFDLK